MPGCDQSRKKAQSGDTGSLMSLSLHFRGCELSAWPHLTARKAGTAGFNLGHQGTERKYFWVCEPYATLQAPDSTLVS